MPEKIKLTVSHRFKASAERVYDAWLDPKKVRVWLSSALKSLGLSGEIGVIEIDPTVGGTFLFTDMREGTEARHWGTYLELTRPEKIVFTWIVDEAEEDDPARVTLMIQPEDTGCVATLVHEMDTRWADQVASAENGWSCMLRTIDELFAE